MERRVEHHHLRHVRAECRDGGIDALHVSLVVERGERRVTGDILDHLGSHQDGAIELGAALDDAVTDR